MAYQVLARKYRPQRFSDVAGQDHVTRTLLNALAQNRIAHGYIFSGHRGIGKTTIARILAMALNCRRDIGSPERPTAEPCEVCESCTEIRAGNAVDVIEIDAATNRGIDEIRELRDAARYRPARDRYKIYILDEAHQITDAAFNALLKTLEEPPDHVIFMMATTQPEDIPQTIRSRSQHFSFHAVSFEDILGELRAIAIKENVGADETALTLLAEAGDGSMRDALSIMDQAIASAPLVTGDTGEGRAILNADQIRELMGTVPNTVFEKLLEQIGENNSAAVMEEANTLLNAGNSASQIARQFVRYLRNTLMAKLGGAHTPLLEISSDERARVTRSALLFTEEELTRFLQLMLRTFDELNYRQEPRFHLELGLMKLVHLQRLLPVEELLSQLGGRPGAGPLVPAASYPTGATSRPAVRPVLPAAQDRPSAQLPTRTSQRPDSPSTASAQPIIAASASAFSSASLPDTGTERPAFSPFEADRNRKRGGEQASSFPTVADIAQVDVHAARPRVAGQATGAMPEWKQPDSRLAGQATIKRQSPFEDQAAIAVAEEEPDTRSGVQIARGSPPTEAAPRMQEHTPPASADLWLTADAQPLDAQPAGTTTALDLPAPEAATPEAATPEAPAADAAALAVPASAVPSAASSQMDAMRLAVVEALAAKGHHTAAALMNEGAWTQTGNQIEARIGVKPKMLGLVMNPDADKTARQVLRELGFPGKLQVVAGEGSPSNAPARPVSQGSIEAQALENPLVKQAQELFRAEIIRVVDLRDKR